MSFYTPEQEAAVLAYDAACAECRAALYGSDEWRAAQAKRLAGNERLTAVCGGTEAGIEFVRLALLADNSALITLKERLRACVDNGDVERAHSEADDLVMALLLKLAARPGITDLDRETILAAVRAWLEVDKWYA